MTAKLPLLLLTAVAAALTACHQTHRPYRHLTIAQFKHTLDSALKANDTTEKNIELEGYYVNEKVPMLISDLKLMRKNGILPDTAYVILSGQGIDSIAKEEKSKHDRRDSARHGKFLKTSYQGALVNTRIDLHITNKKLINLYVRERPIIIKQAQQLISFLDKQINLLTQRLHPQQPVTPDADKFALLYSGGHDSINAHLRYYNDLEFMYATLTEKYGFPAQNITVIYTDGKGEDENIPVDYPATETAVKTAISNLKTKLTPNSTLFTFFTNHGGGYDTLAGVSEGGRPDINHDEEPEDFKKWDEELYYYQQTPNDLWDDSLTVWFAGFKCKNLIILGEPCFGGGLIHDLCGPNRMIFTAANQYEQSFGDFSNDNIDFDTFSYYFTCALNGATYDGKPVDADTNKDGKVSMLEAFLYAKANDKETEHPLMDDSGDGIGVSSPDRTHGKIAARTWLK